jgi:hypothetical protein
MRHSLSAVGPQASSRRLAAEVQDRKSTTNAARWLGGPHFSFQSDVSFCLSSFILLQSLFVGRIGSSQASFFASRCVFQRMRLAFTGLVHVMFVAPQSSEKINLGDF